MRRGVQSPAPGEASLSLSLSLSTCIIIIIIIIIIVNTRQDLLAYLERVALHCHQLSICSRVKAEVSLQEGEVIVSALDSATSLVQAAKNLMTAVILTVQVFPVNIYI